MYALILHGGAGKFTEAHHQPALDACRRALDLGRALLRDGAASLDVVERVVNLLEDAPVFDAGTGSFPNAAGDIEMDAIIISGTTLAFGAVAAVQNVAHPVSVARAVMEKTPHCLLAAKGATDFAHANGFAFVPTARLIGHAASGPDHGTVGAVALDIHGHIAAATSTGGTANKLPGRVGDSPLIGCGAIADDAVGGASATGHGESLMRVMMARAAAELMAGGAPASEAAKRSVEMLARRTGGRGGLICLDAQGRIGAAYNTTHLARAGFDASGDTILAL